MCILCVIQKWSRRVATMLPWLVIPLIALWAISQLLPPAFRFEITSPKLACVFVLLTTLFWYEILMPQLSAWRVRRNAMLRERKRTEAIELQKLRKTATKKCRNCLTPYRDQNPAGGKFMCSYCGHVSKRPVLDLPTPPGSENSNSRLIKDLVGKGGKMLKSKSWSENNWICNQDWLENGNWGSGQFAADSVCLRKNAVGFFDGDSDCLTEKSYCGVLFFWCKLLSSFFMGIRWIWRKIFWVGSLKDMNSSDADHAGALTKRGEHGANFQESRMEKARRKAEEKKQARIEKELEEEEERKQREEVARLVEERRKWRDEKMKAEKSQNKPLPSDKEKDDQKEAERKRQDRRKEKDKGSSKSNSDVEDLDKKPSKEIDRKRESEKKCEPERQEHPKSRVDTVRGVDSLHHLKNSSGNVGRSNAGARYFDRMRGTLLSSSRAFGGSSLFGRNSNLSHTAVKENKFNTSVDHGHTSFRRGVSPPGRMHGKSVGQGDDKSVNRSVIVEPQKKSWQQLFTRSPASETSNVIGRPNAKLQSDVNGPQHPLQSPAVQSFDNPIKFGLPSPFTIPTFSNMSPSNSLPFSKSIDPLYSRGVDRPCATVPEEPELFEDPCYIPDPLSLLGPVSESLDNFQLDRGSGCAPFGLDRVNSLKSISVSSEVIKPSPIESPLARLKADEKHNNFTYFPATPTTTDGCSGNVEDACVDQGGTWHMWKSTPLGQDGLGLVNAAGNWLLPEWNKVVTEDFRHPASKKTMASLFSKDDQVLSGNQSPKKVRVGTGNSGVFSPVAYSCINEQGHSNAAIPSFRSSDGHFAPLNTLDESSHNEVIFESSTSAAISHSSFQSSPVHQWSVKESPHKGTEGFVKSAVRKDDAGNSTPVPDVQSLWSFK